MCRFLWIAFAGLFSGAMFAPAHADERRAAAPTFSEAQLDGVFFKDLSEALRGPRPPLSAIRTSVDAAAAATSSAGPATNRSGDEATDPWSPLVTPLSIEDEIKRVRLHFDSVITTPGAFKGGGYQDARVDLTVLATLFAVIQEHTGDVRWKDQAAAARDLLARTAFNCKSGSTQVYNEAKLRKADLQDLVSGTGLSSRAGEPENDWSSIAARSPLMEYAEKLIDSLEGDGNNATAIKENSDKIKRNSELISMVGEVLTREGMDDVEDEDYITFSRGMIDEAKQVVAAVERGDAEAVRGGIGAIRQRCDACHEVYR